MYLLYVEYIHRIYESHHLTGLLECALEPRLCHYGTSSKGHLYLKFIAWSPNDFSLHRPTDHTQPAFCSHFLNFFVSSSIILYSSDFSGSYYILCESNSCGWYILSTVCRKMFGRKRRTLKRKEKGENIQFT
jgi:hypothetical protein